MNIWKFARELILWKLEFKDHCSGMCVQDLLRKEDRCRNIKWPKLKSHLSLFTPHLGSLQSIVLSDLPSYLPIGIRSRRVSLLNVSHFPASAFSLILKGNSTSLNISTFFLSICRSVCILPNPAQSLGFGARPGFSSCFVAHYLCEFLTC